jgi:hypothetical protein
MSGLSGLFLNHSEPPVDFDIVSAFAIPLSAVFRVHGKDICMTRRSDQLMHVDQRVKIDPESSATHSTLSTLTSPILLCAGYDLTRNSLSTPVGAMFQMRSHLMTVGVYDFHIAGPKQ